MTQVGSPTRRPTAATASRSAVTARSTSPATRKGVLARRVERRRQGRLPRSLRAHGRRADVDPAVRHRRRGQGHGGRDRRRRRLRRRHGHAARSARRSRARRPAALDGFLAQVLDRAARRAWTKQIGTAADEQLWGVAADASGNATVAGFTSGDLFATQQGDKDIVVATFDPAGAMTLARPARARSATTRARASRSTAPATPTSRASATATSRRTSATSTRC